MPPNVRDLVAEIEEALERFPPEAVKEILTYVFKEYVVEGPAPLQASASPLADDLDGLSFARLVTRLQQRLDLPELALFEVAGDRVLVKIGAQKVPLEAPGARPEPAPASPASVENRAEPPRSPMAVPQAAQPLPAPAPAPPPAPIRATPGTSREPLPPPRAPSTLPAGPQPPAAVPPAAGMTPGQVSIKSSPPKSDDKTPHTDRFGKLEID